MRAKAFAIVAALAVGSWGLMGCEPADSPPAGGQQDAPPAPTGAPEAPSTDSPLPAIPEGGGSTAPGDY